MTKGKKIILIIVSILIIMALLLVSYKMFNPSDKDKREIKKVDTIKGFDYHLEDRDTKIYKEEFAKLKKNLESKNINYDEYANSIAKMFIIDLYTINNKVNKYDIGGTEFVYPDALENYNVNAKDTLYKYVIDNSDNKRNQKLPEVKSIKDISAKKSTFKIDENEVESYEITLNWDYVEDLGYDEEALIEIVKKENKLYIVEKTTPGNEDNKQVE